MPRMWWTSTTAARASFSRESRASSGPEPSLRAQCQNNTSNRVKDELLGWSQDRKCLRSTKFVRCSNFLKVRRRRSSWQQSADGVVHGGRVAMIFQSKPKCWTNYSYIPGSKYFISKIPKLLLSLNFASRLSPNVRFRTQPPTRGIRVMGVHNLFNEGKSARSKPTKWKFG